MANEGKMGKLFSFVKRLDLDSRLTAVSLFLLVVGWGLNYLTSPSNELITITIFSLLMLVFFLLLASDRLRFEARIEQQLKVVREQQAEHLSASLKRLELLIDSKLPGTEFIRGEERVESALTQAVIEAHRFIIATGGKSRIKTYLDAITRKVHQEGVPYTRVIFGDYIHHELCDHLCTLVGQPRVRIAHAPDEKSGTALVTEMVLVFTTIPNTRSDVFDTIVKVPNPFAAEEYREYLVDLLVRSTQLDSVEAIKMLAWSAERQWLIEPKNKQRQFRPYNTRLERTGGRPIRHAGSVRGRRPLEPQALGIRDPAKTKAVGIAFFKHH